MPYYLNVVPAAGTIIASNLKPLSKLAGARTWTEDQGDATRNAYIPVTLDPKSFSLRWRRFGKNLVSTSKPVIQNDTLYFAQENGYFVAIKEHDASPIWSATEYYGSTSYRSPVLVNNKVYSAGDTLRAFDATSGTNLFSVKVPNTDIQSALLAVNTTTAFIATLPNKNGYHTDYSIASFDSTSGTAKQSSLFPDLRSILLVDGNLYGVSTKEVRIYDATNLDNYTSIPLPDGFQPLDEVGKLVLLNPTTLTFTGVMYGKKTSTIFNLDTSTKKFRWSVQGVIGTNTAAPDIVYNYTPGNTYLWTVTPTGKTAMVWVLITRDVDDSYILSDLIVTNNLIFLSTDVSVYAIDRTTYKTVWNYPVSGKLSLSDNGILYVTGSSSVTAFNLR